MRRCAKRYAIATATAGSSAVAGACAMMMMMTKIITPTSEAGRTRAS
jgi:hypothetical protein